MVRDSNVQADGLGLVSLFCGPGGLDQGFKDVGFVTRLAYDNDVACIETHRYNHPEAHALQEDLATIRVEDIIAEWERRSPGTPPVGVIGGPPCQSFSVGNAHQSDTDPRHRLPEHYARILKGLNDEYGLDFFVFENVPGLVTKKHKERFERFKKLFEDAGFAVFEGVLDAQDFGVAQVRPRVFVVGVNEEKHPGLKFTFPQGDSTKRKTVREAFREGALRLFGRDELPEPTHFERGMKGGVAHPNHWCLATVSRKFTNGTLVPGQAWGRSFRVLEWDKPSYTVAYGHCEVHVHPNCTRRLSVLEAMLLQGFPPQYVLKGSLSAQIRLVSEAVAPPVAEALARALVEVRCAQAW